MQVNITKRIDTPEGKRYCPVIMSPNGRIKPDWVMVNDRQEKHPEGAYYLDWNEEGKRRRMSVGTDASAAYNSRVRKQRELDAAAAGLIVSNPIEDDSHLRSQSAVDDFLEENSTHQAKKTWRGYCVSLRYLLESCGKCFLEEIERSDLLRFAAFLRHTKKFAPRTVHNKFLSTSPVIQPFIRPSI
jgi:integrase/recombinase XerD